VFTENDTTLIAFQTLFMQNAFGRNMIYSYDESNRASNKRISDSAVYPSEGTMFLENHDITSICKGHLNYRGSLD
jgi:hypothetical protein